MLTHASDRDFGHLSPLRTSPKQAFLLRRGKLDVPLQCETWIHTSQNQKNSKIQKLKNSKQLWQTKSTIQ